MEYSYLSLIADSNGNISSITKDGVTKTYAYYDGTNRIKNTDGSGNDYLYDANANITASLPKGLNPIVYDPFTQMTKSITVAGTPNKMMSFQYSADNERILKNEKQGTTNNLNLYIRGASEYPVIEKINTDNTLTDKIYIYGPTGLIAFKDATATYFLMKDHLGSTRLLFRSTGSQYSTYDYSPFGSLMRSSINGDVDYRFTGQEYDSEFSLYNFRARLYDDELGIFYAVDPAGQNFSPFSYAGNNPVIFVDKDGRLFIIDDILIAIAVGAIISGTTYSVTAAISDDWNWGGFGRSLVAGGIAGFMGSVGGALAQNVGYGMLSSLTGNFATSAIFGDPISTQSIIGSLISGSITGLIPKFQGINSGWFGNFSAEMVYETGRSAVGNALGNGITSTIYEGSFSKGFVYGLGRGALASASQTFLNNVIFGSVISPEERSKMEGVSEMEKDMSLVGNGFGAYGPAIRSGGIAGWVLNGQGTTVGNNLNMPRNENGDLNNLTYLHELAHYYQQIERGFGGFMGRGLYEQINSTLYKWGWGGYNPYITPGNMEWAADILSRFYR